MKKYLFLITSFLTSLVASGVTYYVVPNGAGSKNGTSWANAYADVQTAIDSAYNAGGGEVWIAQGTYKHGSKMTMKNNVAIYGGFAGTETSKNQRVSGNNTIIDGEGKYSVFYNNYTESNPLTNSAKLDNVTIQNGYANDGNDNSISTADYGAGMYNKYASPEITNCTFTTNNSASYGGGMYNYGSTPSLTNCTFSDNSSGSGGGMENYSSSPVLTNCTFSGNNANYGGGMYNEYSSNPVLTNCTFTTNNSTSRGGGMENYSSSPVLTNCTFSANDADYGGGMYNYNSSNPVLTNCTFSANSAGSGGGMYNGYSSSPALTNCTFSNNNSYDGGGICNEDSSPKLTNCILWGNTASFRGNEIYNDDTNSKPTIDTCIIKGGYSSYGTYTNIITEDPKFQPLTDNGGSVQTIEVAEGSSAIGAGKVIEGVTTDARGVVRSTTAPTIGAYEYVKVQTAFESWAENTGLTGDNAKPTATPHNDGITNLEKFTFGLDASKATSYGANASFKHTSDTTGASLQFPVSVDAEGVVNVKALKSVDLINWEETTATATGETSSDGKFKIYKATVPIGEEGKVFLKLKVE